MDQVRDLCLSTTVAWSPVMPQIIAACTCSTLKSRGFHIHHGMIKNAGKANLNVEAVR